jgi:hypothetical protein
MANKPQQETNQSAVTDEDEEWMDAAKAGFPSMDDLAPLASSANPETKGRLVAIWAKENGTAKGENGTYGYTETVTLVLDDGPEGNQVTELVGPAPVRLDLRHSTAGVHSRLKPRVDGTNAKGVRLRFRPMIGRIDTRASTKYKKGSPAFSIAEPTAEDMVIARKHKDMITAINQELEAAEAKSETEEAFG